MVLIKTTEAEVLREQLAYVEKERDRLRATNTELVQTLTNIALANVSTIETCEVKLFMVTKAACAAVAKTKGVNDA